jgi:hypothetical protein
MGLNATAQNVPPYPDAITSQQFYAKTPMAPPPINRVFADPDFGSLMVRVTDEHTNPDRPSSYFLSPPSVSNAWSADNRKFYVDGAGAATLAFAFDPATMTVGPLPGAGAGGAMFVPLRPGPTFSFVDPDSMYGTAPEAPLSIATYRFATGKTELLFDTTTCGTHPVMVAGPKVTSSDLSISADDNRIQISAGGPSGGAHPFIIVIDQKLGCRWYNTETGEIGGQWGPRGPVSTPDRFPINHARISGNGQYARIERGQSKPGFYVWEIDSLKVSICEDHGDLHCGGYGALGYDAYINAPGNLDQLNAYRRPLGDLAAWTPLLEPELLPQYFGMEKNWAWNNGRLDSSAPVCATTYSPSGSMEVRRAYDGEIICVETDGLASTIWRFAHNRQVWDPEYWWTKPKGSLSYDGRWFAFTSTWDGQLGTVEPDSDDPRTDVWIIKLE